jgi:hypothetical protein
VEKMKVRFLFYKAKRPDGAWLDDAISAWTWILALLRLDFEALKYNYSHVELWFPWTDAEGRTSKWRFAGLYLGRCFSSTTRGKWKGVRFAPASEVLKNSQRWDYIEADVRHEDIEVAIALLAPLEGLDYDYAGLFGFLQPLNLQNNNKWYCSEICAYAAFIMKVLAVLHRRISPRRLARELAKQLHGPKKLCQACPYEGGSGATTNYEPRTESWTAKTNYN